MKDNETKSINLIFSLTSAFPAKAQITTSEITVEETSEIKQKTMDIKHFGSTGLSYSQSVKISNYSELLFISGQVPEDENEIVPKSFSEQCRLAWSNIESQLINGGLTLNDLVKVTVFLSDRKFRFENSQIRQEILGDISPSLTIVITGIYEEKWLLEIEAIAAK